MVPYRNSQTSTLFKLSHAQEIRFDQIIDQILLAEIMINGDYNFVTRVYNEDLK